MADDGRTAWAWAEAEAWVAEANEAAEERSVGLGADCAGRSGKRIGQTDATIGATLLPLATAYPSGFKTGGITHLCVVAVASRRRFTTSG